MRQFSHIRLLCRKVMVPMMLLCAWNLYAQSIESLRNARPVTVTGSIFGSVYNSVSPSVEDPSVGYATGVHVNFSFFGNLKIPLSIHYSNNGTLFNTPQIGRIGLSPSYKFIQLHAGYRSYVLNNYLLRGKTILGGGIELTPKKLSFLAFAGKVKDPYSAGNEYLILGNASSAFYDRMMFGGKIGFGRTGNRVSLSAIRTYDKPNENGQDIAASSGILPRDNIAMALETYNTLFKVVTLQATMSGSIMTSDRNGSPFDADSSTQKWLDDFSFLVDINATSRFSMAYQFGAGVQIKQFRVGLRYEHIDPFYNTLGISYIQNNFNNYLLDLSGTLFKSLYVLGNLGIHQINKDGYTGRPQQRIAINTNLNWRANKKLNFNVTYSNYSQKPELAVSEVMDSLSLTSNNTGWNSSVHYKMGTKESPHSLNLYGSRMQFDVVNLETTISSVETLNSSLSYKYSPKNKFNYSLGLQYNTSEDSFGTSTDRSGFLAAVSRVFDEKINIRIDSGYRWNKTDGARDGNVINVGASLTYSPHQKHKFNVSVRYLKRNTTILKAKDVTNIRANYNYSF